MTYADVWRPRVRNYALLYDTALVIGGSLLIALMAQLAIRLPFSPVPVTGQTLAVLLIGALLGKRRGVATVMLYLTEGAMGLSVFAGGTSGAVVLAGPTGGYLMGFVFTAALVGWLAERGCDRHLLTTAGAMLLGNAVIYLTGVFWLTQFVSVKNAIAAGMLPFIAGDLCKIALATATLPLGWRVLGT